MKKRNRVAFFNILSIVLLQGISFFTAPLFMRLLGDSGYGVTQIYNTWVAVIAIAFTLQTHGTLVNARVEFSPEAQKQYQSTSMFLSTVLFAVCASLVMLFLEPVAKLLKLDKYFVVLMLVQAFGTFCVNFLNTRNVYEFKAGQNMLLSMAITVLTLALSLVLILRMPEGMGHYGRITAIAATYGVIGIPIGVWILIRGKKLISRDYWKFCVALAIPAMFYSLSDLILGQSDKVMIQQMLDDASAGQYAAALNFGNIMYIIYYALNNSWVPFFVEDKKQGDWEGMRSRAGNFLELYTVLGVGFILLCREVYYVFAGADFQRGSDLIPVFATAYFLNFLCTFPINYETYYKKTRMVAAVTIVCSVINICLNYVLILKIGMAGAVIATAASRGIQLTIHHLYAHFVLGKKDYPFGLSLWGKYVAAFFMVLALVYLTRGLWFVRWGLGAGIGIWELLRIRKRKCLI